MVGEKTKIFSEKFYILQEKKVFRQQFSQKMPKNSQILVKICEIG